MELEAIYQEIRQVYFPRWNRKNEWTAEFGSSTQLRNNTGYCDSTAKTLYFDHRTLAAMSDDGVRAFIIYEVCHELGAAFHNRGWAQRMESAAKRTDALSEAEVADILRSDIDGYAGEGVSRNLQPNSIGVTVSLIWTKRSNEPPGTLAIRMRKYAWTLVTQLPTSWRASDDFGPNSLSIERP